MDAKRFRMGICPQKPGIGCCHAISEYSISVFTTNLISNFPQKAIGIAEGLAYLHGEGVIHSDIKAV